MKTTEPDLFKWIKGFLLGTFFSLFSLVYTQSTAVDSYIEEFMQNNHIPGCAALLVKNGRVVYENYFGFANLETGEPVAYNTIFMLASTSKTVTATAIMKEYENGCFDITDSIDTHLPFVVRNPNQPDIPITFGQLLTHTSSIDDNWPLMPYYQGDSPIDLYTYLIGYLVPGGTYYAEGNYKSYAPGINYAYSNVAIALIGYLTEYISGIPFDEYCNDSIFTSLCMNTTSWFLPALDTTLIARPYSYSNGEYKDEGLYGYSDYPSGQLRTTAASLAKFMQMYINYGIFNNNRMLDSVTIENMNSAQIPSINSSQGLIFKSYKHGNDTIWGHNGYDKGICSQMGFDKVNKTGVVILMNGSGDPVSIIDKMLDYAAEVSSGTGSILDCDFITSLQTSQPTANTIVIYPNPGNGLFNLVVSISGRGIYMEIFNNLGSLVYKKPILQEVTSFDITDQPAGIYYVRLIQNRNRVGNQIIIKN